MTPAEWLIYANQGATRRQPIAPDLVQAMSFLPEMGLQMKVFSGGQPAIGTSAARVGSTRHDDGRAADVFFYQNGQRLDWANPQHVPIFQDVVRRAKAAGVTGFGAGPGYMQPGSMHIGFGTPAVWGAGGRGANAPDWLRQAYGAATASAKAAGAPRQAPSFGPSVPAMPQTSAGLAQMFAANPQGMSMGVPVDPFAMGVAAAQPNRQQAVAEERRREEDEANERRRVALLSGVGAMFG
jgi:hypothetical protein